MSSEALIHVKASPIRLAADISAEEAFIAVIDACLRHAEANRPAVLQGQMEGVHQMRVAFRRLRSGLKLFRPVVPREASAALVEELRWLNGWLGPARDWDVFLEEGLAHILTRFQHQRSLVLFQRQALRLRQHRHQALQQALEQPRYQMMMQNFSNWLEQRRWREGSGNEIGQKLGQPVLSFATPLLESRHRRVVKRGEVFARLCAEERHALRIRIKELRYALDFFASLYPVSAVRNSLGALSALQDGLGVMNDGAVVRSLLGEAGLKPHATARLLIEGWYGCLLDVYERRFAELWAHYRFNERPWKGGKRCKTSESAKEEQGGKGRGRRLD